MIEKKKKRVLVILDAIKCDYFDVVRETETQILLSNGQRFNKNTYHLVGGNKWAFPYIII